MRLYEEKQKCELVARITVPSRGTAHKLRLCTHESGDRPRYARIRGQTTVKPPMVDVLQRVGQHPAADVVQLTPRLRTFHFADNPLRSDLFVVSG